MSTEHQPEEKRCPNCGHIADLNYCPQCGQATHLHKDTFWGMVVHFVGHYFHYDSKFWQTLKDLVKHPGKLTIAYWEKKRARYLSPISLYIFVSIAYFLLASVMSSVYKKAGMQGSENASAINVQMDSTELRYYQSLSEVQMDSVKSALVDSLGPVEGAFQYGVIQQGKESNKGAVEKKMKSYIPKVFFFMIPVMAFILELLFARRKNTFFVHHAVYSLHYHSFFFITLFLLIHLLPDRIPLGGNMHLPVSLIGGTIFLIWAFVYSVKALRNVYGIKILRAMVYTGIIAGVYSIVFGIVLLITMVIAAATL